MVIPSKMKMKMKLNRCGSRGSSSGRDDNVVDLLPDDIMAAILLLVPPRSLLRLKLTLAIYCRCLVMCSCYRSIYMEKTLVLEHVRLAAIMEADPYIQIKLVGNHDTEPYSTGCYSFIYGAAHPPEVELPLPIMISFGLWWRRLKGELLAGN